MSKLTAHVMLVILFVSVSVVVAILLFVAPAHGQTQIVPANELARMKSILPQLDDKEFQGYLNDPTTMWYTSRTMPSAFQFQPGNGYLPTYFFYSNKNFSGDPSDAPLGDGRGGNANCEFPWPQKPGGAHRSPFVNSFKALWLPKQSNGKPHPVVWFRQSLPGRGGGGRTVGGFSPEGGPSRRYNYENGYGWRFPVDSVFIEVLTTRDSAGYYLVFEVRFRIRENNAWGVELFRPFINPGDLATRIKQLRPDWTEQSQLVAAVNQLEGPQNVKPMRLVDARHRSERAFDVTAGITELPVLPERLVNELLVLTKFQSAVGDHWATGNSTIAYAPTNTKRAHNIVTYLYDGTFVGSDRDSCIKCHESSNHHATQFEVPRGWYGRVRGSDGILSWHPVDPRAVSYSGSPVGVRFRPSFVRDGVIKKYDPSQHSNEIYATIKGLY